MHFRLTGLDRTEFASLFGLDDAELARRGARRCVVDAKPGYPDRIELRDLEPGEAALLVNYVHQPGDSPFRSSHAIYVGERSRERFDAVDRLPEMLRLRPISLRAFDAAHMLRDALLAEGDDVESALRDLLGDPRHAYVHLHFARAGCYAARAVRA